MQLAQAVHAAFHFSLDWPAITRAWLEDSNFLVVVAVPDGLELAALGILAAEEGIAMTTVHEPDLNNILTAIALEPGRVARRLCAQLPLALREPVMT